MTKFTHYFIIPAICSLLGFVDTANAGNSPHLTMQDVLQSVHQHFPQVNLARLEIIKAEGEYRSAVGEFDPTISLTSGSQPVGGYINHKHSGELSVPTLYNGVKLFAGYRNGRGDWPSYYQDQKTNSKGEIRAGMTFPLLRDRAIDPERTALLSASETIRLKQQEHQVTELNVYQEAIKAYWAWVSSGLQLQSYQQLLHVAKIRQNAIVQQVRHGDLAAVAISENSMLIVQREQLINQSKLEFQQASVNLSLYYRDENGKPVIASQKILPQSVANIAVASRQSNSIIMQHPALKRLQIYKKILQFKYNLAQNQLMPNLDASAFVSKQNGSGGDPRLLPNAAQFEVAFKFPIMQNKAKGRLMTLSTELRKIDIEARYVSEQLTNELLKIYQAIDVYKNQVTLLKQELKLVRTVESAEKSRFNSGDSNLFLVNQREQASMHVQVNWIETASKLNELNDAALFFNGNDYTHPSSLVSDS